MPEIPLTLGLRFYPSENSGRLFTRLLCQAGCCCANALNLGTSRSVHNSMCLANVTSAGMRATLAVYTRPFLNTSRDNVYLIVYEVTM